MNNSGSHFYVVFNPLLGSTNSDFPTQAHEFYHRLREQWQAGVANPQMYWGKIKKTKSNAPLDFQKYVNVLTENKKNNFDTHLFISDFNNVWVGKVEEVYKKNDSVGCALDLYINEEVEMWFKVTEMKLIRSNAKETLDFLSCLKSENIDSINPFLGGLRYPLIVKDGLEESYFNDYGIGGSIKMSDNLEATNNSTRLKRLITSFAIPENNFNRLPHVIKNELLSAEMEFENIQNYSGLKSYKMNTIAFSYIQILEGLLNATFVDCFKTSEANETVRLHFREVENGKSNFLSEKNLSLDAIYNVITRDSYAGCIGVKKHLRASNQNEFLSYIKSDLIRLLESSYSDGHKLKDIRNDKAHLEGKINLKYEESLQIRNTILGVGCKGVINEIVDSWKFEHGQTKLKNAA